MKHRVEESIKKVDNTIKEAVYHAWLGYYNSIGDIGRNKTMLAALASQFCHSIGLDNPPPLFRKTALKMGLKGIPGIRVFLIRPKSLDTDFLAASEHILSDLPDPLMISGESGLSDITVEQKLASNSDCLAGSENLLSDISHLAMSSASSCTSEYSAQKHLSFEPKAYAERLNKGKCEKVISSASDLIKKTLTEINGSKDITDDTKKIMDAMFEAAVQQLEGGQIGVRTVALANCVFMTKLRIAMLLLLILLLAVHLLLKFWFVGDQDWPDGLTPT